MSETEDRRFHDLMSFVGIRAPLAASAMVQLVRELRKVGVLDADALKRIKDTMKHEAALSRRPHLSREEFEAGFDEKLDRLLGD